MSLDKNQDIGSNSEVAMHKIFTVYFTVNGIIIYEIKILKKPQHLQLRPNSHVYNINLGNKSYEKLCQFIIDFY